MTGVFWSDFLGSGAATLGPELDPYETPTPVAETVAPGGAGGGGTFFGLSGGEMESSPPRKKLRSEISRDVMFILPPMADEEVGTVGPWDGIEGEELSAS